MKIYNLAAVIFSFIRICYLPNPFVVLDGITINFMNVPILLIPEIVNIFAEPIIHTITFAIVGLYYTHGSEPIMGSTLYMFCYCIIIAILFALCYIIAAILAVVN